MALAWQAGAAAYVPFAPEPERGPLDELSAGPLFEMSGGSSSELTAAAVWQVLGPSWSDPAVAKVSPDLKAASLLAGRFGHRPAGLTGDILLASYLLDPGPL